MADRFDTARATDPQASPLARFLKDGLFANSAMAWARLRSSHRGPVPRDELHDLSWAFWLIMAVIAVVQIGLIFDESSVAWAAALPGWVRGLFEVISDGGQSQWILAPTGVAVLLLLLGRWNAIRRGLRAAWSEVASLLGYVFFSVGGAGMVTNILKQIIGRGRPIGFDDNGWLFFDAFNFNYAHGSFPSGHATTAGAAIVAGILVFPRFRMPIIAVGILVGFSRIIVSAHYPSDVIAGLAVGAAFAYVTARFLLRRRIAFAVDREGHIRLRVAALVGAFRLHGTTIIAAPFRALIGVTSRPSTIAAG